MVELQAIDEGWSFQVASIDGSCYKIAPEEPLKRTFYKNRPWSFLCVIYKWYDEKGDKYN
jgi:hypothetical protein